MTSHTAVSIDNDLATCESGITHWPAHDEAPGGIDVVFGVGIEKVLRNRFLNHLLEDFSAQTPVVDELRMLG